MSVVSIEKYKKQVLDRSMNTSIEFDIQSYVDVLNKSVAEFNSYGVVEKEQLYSTLADFNIGLVKYLHELNKKNAEKEETV